jgi:3'-phosphoadenosine 5'-phosphosulfate sulfotransferase (PAPS reductase)/FAD synthetase
MTDQDHHKRDPFKVDGPTCISFSGGRTSAYMLWRVLEAHDGKLPDDAQVLFCNTGKEEEATLEFVRECSERWNVRIQWLEYNSALPSKVDECDFDSAARNGEPFESVIQQRNGCLPNRMARYCSSELKTRTMHRFLRGLGWEEWDTFIGIRADEPRRVAKFRANQSPETVAETCHMPLADAGIGSHDVADFWRRQWFDLALPNNNGKTMHGNCDLCFLKPAAQVQSLIAEKPERAVWWVKQEAKALSAGIGWSGSRFRDDRPSYAAMKLMAEQQRPLQGFEHEESLSCFCGD